MKLSLVLLPLVCLGVVVRCEAQKSRHLQTDGVPVGYGSGVSGPKYPTTPPKSDGTLPPATSVGSMGGGARAGLAGLVGGLVALAGGIYGASVFRPLSPLDLESFVPQRQQAQRFPLGRNTTLWTIALTTLALALTVGGLAAQNFVTFTPLFGANWEGTEGHADAAWKLGRLFAVLAALLGSLLEGAAVAAVFFRYSSALLAVLTMVYAFAAACQLWVFFLYAGELCNETSESVYGHSCVLMHGGNAGAAAFVLWVLAALPYVRILEATRGKENEEEEEEIESEADEEQGNSEEDADANGSPSDASDTSEKKPSVLFRMQEFWKRRKAKKSEGEDSEADKEEKNSPPEADNPPPRSSSNTKPTEPKSSVKFTSAPKKTMKPESAKEQASPVSAINKSTKKDNNLPPKNEEPRQNLTENPHAVVYNHQQGSLQFTEESVSITFQTRVGSSVLMSVPYKDIATTNATKPGNKFHKLQLATTAGKKHVLAFPTRKSLETARTTIGSRAKTTTG